MRCRRSKIEPCATTETLEPGCRSDVNAVCAARFNSDSFVRPRVRPVSFAYLYCRVDFVCSSNKIRWAFSTASRKSIDAEYQYLAALANGGPRWAETAGSQPGARAERSAWQHLRCRSSGSSRVPLLNRLPSHVLSQASVIACHSNLSQLVTVAAGSIWWGLWARYRSRGLGPSQPAV
jgi:hypothetical protein